jgi:radical SAM protein with 4Fe4S-binding SPASM domain
VGKPLPDELATAEALELIDNMADSGARSLLFSGGEPLERGDFLELARYASQFFSLSLNTNGYYLEERAESLKEIGFTQIQVSLDGASRETHDWLRGRGSFDKAVQALKRCVELDFPHVGIAAMVCQLSFSEVPRMIDLALELGLDFIEFRAFLPIGRGQQISHLALAGEQRKQLYQYLAERQRQLPLIVASEEPHVVVSDQALRSACIDPRSTVVGLGCGAGLTGCAIQSNGMVLPCTGARVELGDLRRERLKDIWRNSPLLEELRDRRRLQGKCGRCEYKFICGGCKGAAYHTYGEVTAEDPSCWYEPQFQL